MQLFKSLFSMFSKSSGLDVSAEHMAFVEKLLAGDFDEAALKSMVKDYLSGSSGDAASLMSVLETVMGNTKAQGESAKLDDILNIVKGLLK